MIDIIAFVVSVGTFWGIYTLLALSLNIENGYAGQPNYGQVLFYSIGAYTSAIVSSTIFMYGVGHGDMDIWTLESVNMRLSIAPNTPQLDVIAFLGSLLVAPAITAIFGYIASFPALRLSRDYFALVLFLFGEVGRIIARTYYPIAGGAYGAAGIINPFAWLQSGWAISAAYLVVVWILVLTAFAFTQRLVNSPFGRLLKSIRDDELASMMYGKNVPWRKSQIMMYGSALAGLAGTLFAHYCCYIHSDDFIPVVTFEVWVIMVLGGVANNTGMFVGALIMTLIDRFTRLAKFQLVMLNLPFDLNYLRYVAVGIIFILVLMYRPKGLVPEKPVKTPAWEVVERGEDTGTS